jgi:hypothetical protein
VAQSRWWSSSFAASVAFPIGHRPIIGGQLDAGHVGVLFLECSAADESKKS